MRLVRNETRDGKGKYALWHNQKRERVVEDHVGGRNEFFVVMLKDENAHDALKAYAKSAAKHGDKEYADEVMEMAMRAGPYHPNCKAPD